MAHWAGRLIGGTRGRILSLLRAEPATVAAIARRVEVSDNAVRAHLTSLQRDGLVEEGGVAHEGGVGKPAQLYRTTGDAEELFPKAYAAVLVEVLRTVAERDGEEGLLALLREVGRRTAGRREANATAEARLASTEAALRSLGADVEVEAEAPGHWRIEGNGCPLSAVVREQAVACTLVESVIAEVSGGRVSPCRGHGARPRCSFQVDLASADG